MAELIKATSTKKDFINESESELNDTGSKVDTKFSVRSEETLKESDPPHIANVKSLDNEIKSNFKTENVLSNQHQQQLNNKRFLSFTEKLSQKERDQAQTLSINNKILIQTKVAQIFSSPDNQLTPLEIFQEQLKIIYQEKENLKEIDASGISDKEIKSDLAENDLSIQHHDSESMQSELSQEQKRAHALEVEQLQLKQLQLQQQQQQQQILQKIQQQQQQQQQISQLNIDKFMSFTEELSQKERDQAQSLSYENKILVLTRVAQIFSSLDNELTHLQIFQEQLKIVYREQEKQIREYQQQQKQQKQPEQQIQQKQQEQIKQQQPQQQRLAYNKPQSQKDPFSAQDLIEHFSNNPGDLLELKATDPELAKAIVEKHIPFILAKLQHYRELEIKEIQKPPSYEPEILKPADNNFEFKTIVEKKLQAGSAFKHTQSTISRNESLNNVIEAIFYKVWKNVVIRNQILSYLRERGKMNGFSYDSISNSVWMVRNGYYGLLLDKLKQTKFGNRTKFASMITTIDDYVLRSIAKHPNQDELLQIIIDYYPHIILSTPDIIDCVCQGGNLSALIIIHQWIESLSWMSSTSTNAMDSAAENGHYEIVKFLLDNRSEGCTEKAIIGAAKNGHLHIVTLLAREKKPISYIALDMAATFGHFEILEFLYFSILNLPSPFRQQPKYPSRFIISDYLNDYNNKNNNNEIKDSQIVQAKQVDNSSNNNNNSKKSNNNNNNSKGKKSTTTPTKPTITTTTTSTNTITTQLFKLKEENLKENQKQIENQICSSAGIKGALLNGHMKCVLFLDLNVRQPFELTREDLNEIASRGNTEVLEYLRQRSVNLTSTFDPMCRSSDAFYKIQEILQDVEIRNFFKITVKCFENAAIGNQLRTFQTLLQYLVLDATKGKPFFSENQLQFTESLDWAAKHENFEMMELINQHFYGIATYALFNAVQCGNIKLIKWLLEKRAEPMPTNAMISAISTGNINVVSLVFDNTKEEISHHTRECARIHRVRSIYWKISLFSVQNQLSKLIVRDLLSSVGSRFRERFHNEYGSPKFRLFHSVEITNITQFFKDLSLDTKNRYEPIPYKDQFDGQIKYSFPLIEWRCVPDIFFIFNDQSLLSAFNKRIIIIDILAIEPISKDGDGNAEEQKEQQTIISEAEVSIRSKYIPLITKLKQPELFPDFEISVFPLIILNGKKVILDNQFTELIVKFAPLLSGTYLESKMGYIFESNEKEYNNEIVTDENLKNSYVTLQEHLHFVNKPKIESGSGKVENKIVPPSLINFSLDNNNNRNNVAPANQDNHHIAELKHKPSKMDRSDNFIFKENTFVIVNPELVRDNHIRLLLKSNTTSQTISIHENKIYCDCPIFSYTKNEKEYCSHIKNIMLGKFELEPGDQDSTFTSDQFNQIKFSLKLDYKPKPKVLNKV